MFVDTHCHLYPSYYEDLEDIINQFKPDEIYRVINNGIDKSSNIEVVNMVNKYDSVYGAIGIHPESVDNYTEEDIKYIERGYEDFHVKLQGLGAQIDKVESEKEFQKFKFKVG